MFIPPMDMFAADKDGKVNDVVVGHYADYAHRGFGGIIQEASAVTPEGRISPVDVGIWSDDFISGLKRIVSVVHAENGKIGIQLAHAGRKGSTYTPGESNGRQYILPEEGGWQVVGPSDDAYNDLHGKPHALTVEEIQEVVAAFAAAAKRAVACGYDFIEIHAAHGYLLHEFLSPLSNHRTDSYGGSFENRIRLVKEVACAVRKAIPEGMPLFVRISASDLVEGNSWDVPEAAKLCTELVQNCGVDMMDISSAGLSDQQVIPSNWDFQEQMSHTIKKETGVVCSAVGGICDAASASYVVDELGIDIVEIGKAALFHFFNPREIALQMGHPMMPCRAGIAWALRVPRNYRN
ncbi:NADH-dependent flavin oxidoreductase [Blastocystis sp. ATCC 50177/Nand II]|uniref:NADH-dependent flavin oxidoreductase n=1 Tax=Blastocystis sp. subtype 1 (strain ATCC 50177 / NandII) TaxID=478820 RepID=A0A196SA39_BLAHN|nr:NADH-dependent flavin oxidoreductase [Blastocystis sp. ATCC 50177/Nand II]